MLTTEQDSIFDWLASSLSMIMAAGGHIPPWAKENDESIACLLFSFGTVYLYLLGKGLVLKKLSFFKSTQMFQTFGSIVPNTVKQDQFLSLLLSVDFSTSCTYQWRTHSILNVCLRDMHPCPRPFIVYSLLISTFTFPWRQCQIT